jgi:hypothetical protein
MCDCVCPIEAFNPAICPEKRQSVKCEKRRSKLMLNALKLVARNKKLQFIKYLYFQINDPFVL